MQPMRIGLSLIVSSIISFSLPAAEIHMVSTKKNHSSSLGDENCMTRIKSEIDLPADCIAILTKQQRSLVLTTDLPKRVVDWGSHGVGGKPWYFSDERCNQFFADAFSAVSNFNPSIKLSPHDLFHAHLISYEASDRSLGIALVMHAREYPYDLESIKNYYQVETESFSSKDAIFLQRNYLYVTAAYANMHPGLYLVKNEKRCKSLFEPSGKHYLSEKRLSHRLPRGKWLGDVNIFLSNNLERIKYNFYRDERSANIMDIEDMEGRDSGKTAFDRYMANFFIDRLIERYDDRPLIYFLTGI